MKLTKIRIVYMAATCIILVAGLSTRVLAQYFPDFIATHFGDALWAAMIYCGFRVIGARKSLKWSLILSLMFCLTIELSQLYQPGWLNTIRGTLLGGLILGKGFLIVDLIRYAVGIMIIYFIDRLWNRLKKQR